MVETTLDTYRFDPDQPALWAYGSDADWLKGEQVARLQHPGRLAADHPWLVPNRLFAQNAVQANKATVLRIIGTLLSWRTPTLTQLQALADAPPFHRDEPNLYGALCRLGALSIGEPPAIRYRQADTDTTGLPTWASLSGERRLIRDVVGLCVPEGREGDVRWMVDMLGGGRLGAGRVHVRHNTFAAHAGVCLSRDARVVACGGDGWSGLEGLDPVAVRDAGVSALTGGDVLAVTRAGVSVGLEVQSSAGKVMEKSERWARVLAASPLSRRGLVCVWVFIPQADGSYATMEPVLERVRALPHMMVGSPVPVGMRMGWARWHDWFGEGGEPTARLGVYTDMTGRARSVFDPQWQALTPPVADPDRVRDWGWTLMTRTLRDEWGVDVSRWRLPDAYRGGFHGFALPDTPHTSRPDTSQPDTNGTTA